MKDILCFHTFDTLRYDKYYDHDIVGIKMSR